MISSKSKFVLFHCIHSKNSIINNAIVNYKTCCAADGDILVFSRMCLQVVTCNFLQSPLSMVCSHLKIKSNI